MTDLLTTAPLAASFAALRRDLISDEGPRISAVRNYPFALLVYPPKEEFDLRQQVQTLTRQLERAGWSVLTLSLQRLLLARLRATAPGYLDTLIRMERTVTRATGEPDPARGLNMLRDNLPGLIEGPHGLAADVIAHIQRHREAHPHKADRTVVLIGRAGALYPFFSASALLKHLDGHTGGVPTVVLYPGAIREGGLSFMDKVPPDRDYRPRIYGVNR